GDALSRKRVAAPPEAHHDVVDAAHLDAALGLPADQAEELLQRSFATFLAFLRRTVRDQVGQHLLGGQPAIAHCRDHRLLVLEPERVGGAIEIAALAELAELLAIAAEVAVEQLGADLEAAATLLDLDPVADALFGTRGGDDLQPIFARGLARG